MSQLVRPHGADQLRPLLLEGEAKEADLARAASLPRLPLSSRETGDLIMLGIGGFTPLDGFMGSRDWRCVCDHMRLENGLFWPIPITLSCAAEVAETLGAGAEVALVDPRLETVMAIMNVTEVYTIDKEHECRTVFGTTDTGHPGVRMVMDQGDFNVAGPVRVLSQGDFGERFPGVYMTPAQTRALLASKGWTTVAAFQTRNPMHRSHEHLVKTAIEVCDGVLVHSLLGRVKPGDIPADVRSRAINALLENYFVPDTIVHAGYPLDMRYAGPREALLHALFRQNYGCSHLIVGRDHAGVASFYGPFDAQQIFDDTPEDALLTKPLKMDWTFWCDRCDGMASMRTCPHGETDRLFLSGSKLRKLLSEGDEVPLQFSRREVLDVLRDYYAALKDDERVEVIVSGHSAR